MKKANEEVSQPTENTARWEYVPPPKPAGVRNPNTLKWAYIPPQVRSNIPSDLLQSNPKFDRQPPDRGILQELENSREEKLKQLLITEFGASADHAARICSQIKNEFEVSADPAFRSVPSVAPILYRNRPNKTRSNDSLEFLKEHYGPWLADAGGGLYQHTLRKIDPGLMMALDNLFRGRRDEFAAILPSRAHSADRRLEAVLGYVPEGKDRKIALTALSNGRRPFARRQP
jgi:hypothetical protein